MLGAVGFGGCAVSGARFRDRALVSRTWRFDRLLLPENLRTVRWSSQHHETSPEAHGR